MTNSRRIKLRCVLDPLPNTAGNMNQDVNVRGEPLKELFYISAELDAPIDTLRRDIAHELGVEGKFSVGVYKVGLQNGQRYFTKLIWAVHRFAFRGQRTINREPTRIDMPYLLICWRTFRRITWMILNS